jgi:CDP-diacylglycerol---serine O-phosphatidyltransferase
MPKLTDEPSDTLRVTADSPLPLKRRQKLFAVLPTLLTLGNAACGFGAITFAAKVGPLQGVENELWTAAALIYVAMIFDMFDGSAARWANQTSEFGALLDSLCDAISFGVAPAFLMLQFTKYKHIREMELNVEPFFNYPDKILWIIAALFMICVILRLARFTVETDEDDSHEFFSGLPSPAGAGVVASFPIMIWGVRDLAADQEFFGHEIAMWLVPAVKFAVPIVTLVVAFLMVSRLRYPHFVNQLFSGRRSRKHLLQILVALVLIALVPGAVLFLVFAYFAFAAPAIAAYHRVFKKDAPAAEPDSEFPG